MSIISFVQVAQDSLGSDTLIMISRCILSNDLLYTVDLSLNIQRWEVSKSIFKVCTDSPATGRPVWNLNFDREKVGHCWLYQKSELWVQI